MFKNILLNNLIAVSRVHLRTCVALLSISVAAFAMFLIAPQAYAQALGATASFAPTSVVSGANAVLTITISNLVCQRLHHGIITAGRFSGGRPIADQQHMP